MTQREPDAATWAQSTNASPTAIRKEVDADDAAAMLERDREVKTASRARSSRLRLGVLAIIAIFPSFLKRACYRLFFG